MKPLDWRIDGAQRELVAHSRPTYGEFRLFHPAGQLAWAARLDGKELARGSLPKCLAACEESEALAAVTEMRARTADGQSLTPAELGLPTEPTA